MKRYELAALHANYLQKHIKYKCVFYKNFDYKILQNNIIYRAKAGRGHKETYSDCIISFDTETSKSENVEEYCPEYNDIKDYCNLTIIKEDPDIFDSIDKEACKSIGLKFDKSGIDIDILYDELKDRYFYIFPEEYNAADCLYNIYSYLSEHKPMEVLNDNYIVAWTISIRAYEQNIITLYGNNPWQACDCMKKLRKYIPGDILKIYVHNLNYDWFFMKKFLIHVFNKPDKQLNTAPHKPLFIRFNNGIQLQDSYILAQRSLEKWANDLNIEHKKAVGSWDYNLIRHQNEKFSEDEILYIQNDTIGLCECIDATMKALGKNITSIPFTATGIPRYDINILGKAHQAKEKFLKAVCDFYLYNNHMLNAYHGGYVHANRYFVELIIKCLVKCKDFTSSYPTRMLIDMFPLGKFNSIADMEVSDILEKSAQYGFLFKLTLVNVKLKNPEFPMPLLQYSKCIKYLNEVLDNGRILSADLLQLYSNEIDLELYYKYYEADAWIIEDCYFSRKSMLPKWLRDYIFQLFKDKSEIKGKDDILYSILKAKLNSIYGMTVQRAFQLECLEDYETGEYYQNETDDPESLYLKSYVNNRNRSLLYQIGIWVTSYSTRELFKLGEMCDIWLYSDTDSCYGIGWHEDEVNSYNDNILKQLQEAGYDAFYIDGIKYQLGEAITEGDKDCYSEFKILGAKRYAGRCVKDNEIHITVAGVPKKSGAKCLKNDLSKFTKGFLFKGTETGKLAHEYISRPEIFKNQFGDWIGDSINLEFCDYLLDNCFSEDEDIKGLRYHEDYNQIYDESEYLNGANI